MYSLPRTISEQLGGQIITVGALTRRHPLIPFAAVFDALFIRRDRYACRGIIRWVIDDWIRIMCVEVYQLLVFWHIINIINFYFHRSYRNQISAYSLINLEEESASSNFCNIDTWCPYGTKNEYMHTVKSSTMATTQTVSYELKSQSQPCLPALALDDGKSLAINNNMALAIMPSTDSQSAEPACMELQLVNTDSQLTKSSAPLSFLSADNTQFAEENLGIIRTVCLIYMSFCVRRQTWCSVSFKCTSSCRWANTQIV